METGNRQWNPNPLHSSLEFAGHPPQNAGEPPRLVLGALG